MNSGKKRQGWHRGIKKRQQIILKKHDHDKRFLSFWGVFILFKCPWSLVWMVKNQVILSCSFTEMKNRISLKYLEFIFFPLWPLNHLIQVKTTSLMHEAVQTPNGDILFVLSSQLIDLLRPRWFKQTVTWGTWGRIMEERLTRELDCSPPWPSMIHSMSLKSARRN